MPAGLQNDTAVIMYKSERKPVGAISVKVDHIMRETGSEIPVAVALVCRAAASRETRQG